MRRREEPPPSPRHTPSLPPRSDPHCTDRRPSAPGHTDHDSPDGTARGLEPRRSTPQTGSELAGQINTEINGDEALGLGGDTANRDWVEVLPVVGPSVSDLVFPPWLLEEWRHDARWLATGRAVRVLLIGSPGVGKTAAARRVGRDAFRLAQSLPNGRKARGICVLDPSVGMTGCSYVPQTENILLLAMRRARQLTESGYICVLILDEADAILGEWPDRGTEHAHNRSRRLAAQYTLSEDIEGMAIYLTMNTRRGLRLSAAITRRFLARNYPRPTRGQIAAVARYYIGRHSDILGQVGMSAEEFGQELADNLFSDRRVVAIAHLRSGRDLAVRARDLQTCSPGQVERSIAMWCLDMTHGVSRSMDDLWSLLDRDFSAPALSARNLHDLTFIEPSAGDGLIALEFMARSRGARRYPGESGNDPRNGG